MGKVVKGIAIGFAVGAVVVATGGLGIGIGAGTFLGVGGAAAAASGIGFAVTATSLAIVGGIGGAIIGGGLALVQAASKAFIKKPNMDLSSASDAVQRLTLSIDPNAISKLVFGATAMGTDIVYVEKIDGDKVLYVIELAGHEIDAITGFYINDEAVTFSGNAATGDWAGILWRYVNLGTESQTYLSGFGASWPSTAAGKGRAHMALVWDLKAGQEKLSGGIPTRITTVGRGALCYDPRLDTTVGGSGAHRADDQSTWQYSANWAVIVLSYLLGWRTNGELVIGKGENPANIDYDSWIAMANVCSESIDGDFRYFIAGLFSATNDHESILGQFESAINARISKIGGKWYCWVPHDDLTPSGTITEADLVRDVGVVFSPSGEVRDLYNTGRGRYVNASLLYQSDFYPDVVEASAVTEDGGERILPADYSIIQNVAIAERVTRTKVRRSRFSATWAFAMSMKGLLYRPFSIVTLNIQETNYEDVTVRVLSMPSSDWRTGIVSMVVIEEDASIYDDTIPLGTPVTQLDPGSYNPATKIAVTGLGAADTAVTGSSGTAKNYLLVSWTDPGGFVDHTDIQYRVKTGPGATQDATGIPIDLAQALVGPVEQTTVYEVRARHVTIFGVVGDWSSWVEETSGASETVGSATSVPWTGVQDDNGGLPENNATNNTNTENIIRNPGAETGAFPPHTGFAGGGNWNISGDQRFGAYAFSFNSSGQTSAAELYFNGALSDTGTLITVSGGEQIYLEGWAKLFSGTANRVRAILRWRDSSGAHVGVTEGTLLTPTGSYAMFSVSGTPPAGASFFRPAIEVVSDGNTCVISFDDMNCVKKRGTSGLEAGAVTASDSTSNESEHFGDASSPTPIYGLFGNGESVLASLTLSNPTGGQVRLLAHSAAVIQTYAGLFNVAGTFLRIYRDQSGNTGDVKAQRLTGDTSSSYYVGIVSAVDESVTPGVSVTYRFVATSTSGFATSGTPCAYGAYLDYTELKR